MNVINSNETRHPRVLEKKLGTDPALNIHDSTISKYKRTPRYLSICTYIQLRGRISSITAGMYIDRICVWLRQTAVPHVGNVNLESQLQADDLN